MVILIALWAIAGCVPTKKLKKDEYLLYSQTIKGNKAISTDELESFFRQKPNRKILYLPFSPYLYAYYAGKKKYDRKLPQKEEELSKLRTYYARETAKMREALDSLQKIASNGQYPGDFEKDSTDFEKQIRIFRQKGNDKIQDLETKITDGNWLMRTVGEPPSIFDEKDMRYAQEQMQKYLNTQGFFHNRVTVKQDSSGKRIKLEYEVIENQYFTIRKIDYQIADSLLADTIKANVKASFIQPGERYREENLEKERNRITRLAGNIGYFDFEKNYIFFKVDTTIEDPYQLDIALIVKNPPDENQHRVYTVDSIVFETGVDVMRIRNRLVEDFRGITFVQAKDSYNKKLLSNKVGISLDAPYNMAANEETQRVLAMLDVFKFVNINYEKLGDDKLKANIFTSDYKKYQYSLEAGLNVGQSLPGPFVSLSFKNRNLLRGAEILELRARASIEAIASATDAGNNFSSQEYGVNGSLTFPQFIFPISTRWRKKIAPWTPRTQLLSGFTFINRPEYTRSNLQGAISYLLRTQRNETFQLSILDLSLVNTTRLRDDFLQRLLELEQQGNTLRQSFDSSLVVSVNLSYIKASEGYGEGVGNSWYLRVFGESGGALTNLLNRAFNSPDGAIFGLRYFRFLKLAVDYRHAFRTGQENQLAGRVHVGIARPYGSGLRVLPYEKYFFTGGTNSNRAWRPRRIGPGSYSPGFREDGSLDDSFEQQGELLFEANFEYRNNLFSFVDGAIFLDASNVWMLQEDQSRPGAKFELRDFWKEIAVGAGFGLRLDFSFLLIRFDLGLKMYDPARQPGERFVARKILEQFPLGQPGQAIFNLGIGYPF